MPAFHVHHGMPIWLELWSEEPKAMAEFYSAVLGWDFQPEEGEGHRALAQGLPVASFPAAPWSPGTTNTWLVYLLAKDLDAQAAAAQERGAELVLPPTPTPRGVLCLVKDPCGALVGLCDPTDEEPFTAAGEPGTPVWHELTAPSGYEATLDFYRELVDWDIQDTASPEGQHYGVAENEGGAFAGVRDASQLGLPEGCPGSWVPFFGTTDVARAAELVVAHGGEVLSEPVTQEFGRILMAVDPGNAAFILCEVPEYVGEGEDAIAEGDDILSVFDEHGPGAEEAS